MKKGFVKKEAKMMYKVGQGGTGSFSDKGATGQPLEVVGGRGGGDKGGCVIIDMSKVMMNAVFEVPCNATNIKCTYEVRKKNL